MKRHFHPGQDRVSEEHIRAGMADQLTNEFGDVTPIIAFFQIGFEIKYAGVKGANTSVSVAPIVIETGKSKRVGFKLDGDKHPMLVMPRLYEWTETALRYANKEAHFGGTWIIAYGHPWDDTLQPSHRVLIPMDADGDNEAAVHTRQTRPGRMIAMEPKDLVLTAAPAILAAREQIKDTLAPGASSIVKFAQGERAEPIT